MTASDDLPEKLSEICRRIAELKARAKDPEHVDTILSSAFNELELNLEELIAQNEELVEAAEENQRLLTAVQEERDKLSALVNSIGDEVWFADTQKRFTLANPSALREFGLSSDGEIDIEKLATSLEVYRPDGSPRPVDEAPPLRAIRGEVIRNQEEMIRTPATGELRYRQVSAAPVRDASGCIIGSVSVVRDITDYKRMEKELAHLASFPRLNPNPITEVDQEGCVHYLNNAAQKLFPDLQEKGLTHPWLADWKQVSRMVQKSNPQGCARDVLIDGIWYQQSIYSIPEPERIRIYGLDINSRKKMEEALLESEQRYATTLASIGDAVIATDLEGKITFMNKIAEELTGWTLHEASMKPTKEVFNIINEHTRQKVDDPITKVLENGTVVGLANHTILIRKDGTEVAIDDSGAPIKDREGNISGVVLVFRDIIERRRAEEALQKAKDDMELKVQERTVELVKAKDTAEAAVEAKAAFLANMSHELRTPMNAVIGFSSLLLDDTLDPEHRDYIEGIRKGGEALLAIINDILDFSRTDKDMLELEHLPFSLKDLIDESLGMIAVQASKKELNLSQTINYGTPDTIVGDPGRLRQVLVNLLSNAVKFTDNGDVSVAVSSRAIEGNLRQIFFEVKDTGIGVSLDKMDEIFKPFAQVERTLSLKRDGVGLGLAITKNLVELMGGTIWAESNLGQGMTFRVMIPAETVPCKQFDSGKVDRGADSEILLGLKPLRILVAEDNPSNLRVLVEMLKRLGYRADAVADGKEVVQALKRQDYDLVLMDIKMPEMDGITATRVIRKLLPENGPKIVAITAFALEGDREKCLEAGMNGYIAKPVKKEDLAEVLKKYGPETR